jgi:hypothetical protein
MLLQNPEILAEERTSEEKRLVAANTHQRFLYYPQNNTKENIILSCI